MEKPKGDSIETVEYRDAGQDYTVRLVLRTSAGTPPARAGDVENLRCNRVSEGRIYQIIFTIGGRKHYSTASMVRCEEEKKGD